MSKIRVTWLLVIIGIELVAITGLLIWAITVAPAKKGSAPAAVHKSKPVMLKPPVVTPVLYASGFDTPTVIAAAPDAGDKRLFVAERQGLIRVIDEGGDVAATPFMDIKNIVNDDKNEMGLLGLAFHPKFKENGYFFVNYNDKDRNTIIARFQVDKKTGAGDPATRKILLTIAQPYPNHKGGAVVFGPDGYLYIGMGDGGSGGDPGNRAQDKTQLLGKILRIDVDHGDPYTIPASNPFLSQKGEKQEIWALGLRNPWKLSFDKKTGDLYIADVGQGDIEEIDFQAANDKGGQNYGWRCFEGTHKFNPDKCQEDSHYVLPALEYDHKEKRCSVTGGYVYRGVAEPALAGKYFYGDFCSGQIYSAERQQGAWKFALAASTPYSISTFGQNASGELFVADLATGTIYHLTDTAN